MWHAITKADLAKEHVSSLQKIVSEASNINFSGAGKAFIPLASLACGRKDAISNQEQTSTVCIFIIQWNLCIVVTLGPIFYGYNIEGGCIIEVHNTLAICTLGPDKVALLERLAAIE